jgi:hypothetical protein
MRHASVSRSLSMTNGNVRQNHGYGGLNNTATYIGMIPRERLGIVVLSNCGGEPATRIGRQIMLALARSNAVVSEQGHMGDWATERAAGVE